MMANSTLGLPSIQHNEEVINHTYSILTDNDFIPNKSDTQRQSNLSIGPIKRKRGRPRKYTLGPYSSQSVKIENPNQLSGSRLSLPSNYICSMKNYSTESFSSQNDPHNHARKNHGGSTVSRKFNHSAESFLNGIKKVKNKTSPKIFPTVDHKVNGNSSDISVPENLSINNNNGTSILPTFPTESQPFDARSSGSLFRFPAPVITSVVNSSEFTSQQMPLNPLSILPMPKLPELTINSSGPATYPGISCQPNFSQLSMPIHHTTYFDVSKTMHSPTTIGQFYVDPIYCGNNFGQSSSSTPVSSVANFEVNLIGRLLPQAEAAIRAAKTAGFSGPHTWTPNMVSAFIALLPGCKGFAQTFAENEIDGPALLCLEQHDLMSILKLKLGPAVKVFGAIRALRRTMMSIPYSDLSADHATALAAATSCFSSPCQVSPKSNTSPSHKPKQQSGFSVKKLASTNNEKNDEILHLETVSNNIETENLHKNTISALTNSKQQNSNVD